MLIFAEKRAGGLMARRDPRLRVAGAFGLVLTVVLLNDWLPLGLALAAALALLVFAGRRQRNTWRRFGELNFFVLFLFALTPLSMPGQEFFGVYGLTWSVEGVAFAGRVAIKANTAMALCAALLGGLEPATLAHALQRLGLPEKLTQILFFCIRYLDVCHHEYHRLRNAMKLRGFEARFNWHSLRGLGHFLGMLLVRGIDRSDRILEAMKCRGYTGRFFSFSTFRFSAGDALFGGGLAALGAALTWIEWTRS
ncbi:MAG: cobalt ECF transporter T component CbiQ [Lentisphaeria bacterium]|nr:cobalt ECF transporter T component CbiQ [Lentisphaeria bacterium]